MQVIVDNRENRTRNGEIYDFAVELEELLSDKYVITTDNLKCGDFQFLVGEELIAVVERKTWSDLAASIGDHIDRQTQRMQDVDCQYKFFLIEGTIPTVNKKYPGGLTGKSLLGKITGLALGGFGILISAGYEDSAWVLANFIKRISNNRVAPSTLTCNTLTGSRLDIWKLIGCTRKVAEYMNKTYSPIDILYIDIEDILRDAHYPSGRRISAAIIDKICRIVRDYDQQDLALDILQCVKGIGQKTIVKIRNELFADGSFPDDQEVFFLRLSTCGLSDSLYERCIATLK
jgi:ERCC4-type nuclease